MRVLFSEKKKNYNNIESVSQLETISIFLNISVDDIN